MLRMAFWICPLVIQPFIALAMFLRRQVRDFPLFLTYILFASASDFTLLLVTGNLRLYSWIYWMGEPITDLLGLAAIYEVIWHLIRGYSTLRIAGVRLFWINLGVGVVLGLLLLRSSSFNRIPVTVESARLIERSVWFAETGILILFLFFISHVGLTWKHYAAGIITGFGVAAGFGLVSVQLEASHAISGSTFSLLKSATYNCAVFFWAIYFLPTRPSADPPKRLPTSDLARWDELLRRYLNR